MDSGMSARCHLLSEVWAGRKSDTAAQATPKSMLAQHDCTASFISTAVDTSMRRCTRSGVGKDTGPATSVTSAPWSAKAEARAKPIFPLLRLPRKRTASSGSWVGPAVMSTCLPDKGRVFWKCASTWSAMSSGSAMRPLPTKPLANGPVPGSTMSTPRDSRTRRFSWVEACVNMSRSMAGATATGQRALRSTACNKFSHWP